ncbi:MAG: crossover junction endodeoxyribonuclease RuvC [Chromatiales bacterium]|jgi:crossover junction endodeoxyribonuclease RuvC
MRRILGIDPGSRVTGYAVIESNGSKSVHIAHGCIKTGQQDFAARLGEIFSGMAQVIDEFAPQDAAVEQVFMAKNAASALKLGQARGAAICAAVQAGLPVFEYSARSVKQSVVGTGAADKQQVQQMVKMLLQLQGKLPADASDALGIALTHAHSMTTKLLLKGATGW